jgi:hypothetical protein
MRYKSIFQFDVPVFMLMYVMNAGQFAHAVTIDVQPPNPTNEDIVIIQIVETLQGCVNVDSIRTSAQDTLFDFDVWISGYGMPYITCPTFFDLHLADTIGPLVAGTHCVRTTWDWTYDDRELDSLFGEPYVCEKQFVVTGPLDIREVDDAGLPSIFVLHQNYPNPFNSGTTISFSLREPADVELSVYNILGRQVRQLATESCPVGEHQVLFDGNDGQGHSLPSGVYFCRATAGRQSAIRRIVLLK